MCMLWKYGSWTHTVVNTCTLSSKGPGWKCFVNIWQVIKRYFLKKTQIIIVSFDEYTVYIMFWFMMLYDWYCIIFIFLSKYHCVVQCKIGLFLKVIYRIWHQKHYKQLKYRYILHLRINEMLPKNEKNDW